jgi:hypothetical protein
MRTDSAERLPMTRKTVLELPPQRPLDVRSAGGTVWLTLDGDPRDLVLERGERVLIEARGRVLAYAFDDAVLEVASVHEPLAIAARRGFQTAAA